MTRDDTKHNAVWVRLAANKNAFTKTGCIDGMLRWRYFIDPDPTERFVTGAVITGLATEKNSRTQDLTEIDASRGLLAWLWYYGNARLDKNKRIHIELLDPPHEPTL